MAYYSFDNFASLVLKNQMTSTTSCIQSKCTSVVKPKTDVLLPHSRFSPLFWCSQIKACYSILYPIQHCPCAYAVSIATGFPPSHLWPCFSSSARSCLLKSSSTLSSSQLSSHTLTSSRSSSLAVQSSAGNSSNSSSSSRTPTIRNSINLLLDLKINQKY